jgi:hypothetical protein
MALLAEILGKVMVPCDQKWISIGPHRKLKISSWCPDPRQEFSFMALYQKFWARSWANVAKSGFQYDLMGS